ncbi:hypothetical protein KC359_g145 [Hortaea werneckii]|nr:hypothetical protein KC359_g145 [Hortaea werneckii]
MASHLAFVTFAAAYMLRPAFAKDPFTFCTEASCSDCPISVTSAGTPVWCTILVGPCTSSFLSWDSR